MTLSVREILSSSEELYRLLVQQCPDAILFFDLSDTILAANDGAARLLGVQAAEELVGQNAVTFLDAGDRPRAREDIARLLDCENLQGLDYRVLHQDGNVIPVEMSASVIREQMGLRTASIFAFTTFLSAGSWKRRLSDRRRSTVL